MNVEELALEHYASAEGGGWVGVHSEGGVWATLFGLLMWDVLFGVEVEDVFRWGGEGRHWGRLWKGKEKEWGGSRKQGRQVGNTNGWGRGKRGGEEEGSEEVFRERCFFSREWASFVRSGSELCAKPGL